ncbi:hypothetical protein SELMODRAFT_108956 [Selaginella moellendorffii]|uniref:Protein KTI12 homolog n=1 Tax=Selaginella moellendorffii TaxID=88036 RepID=D8S509_SELML|nr:hypothetical protein SELMODRAFT_108956 [Selaginella moellendorffii]
MALVVMCGQPCSGKSAAAASLIRGLEAASLPHAVKLIDETSLGLDRNESYQDMFHEKNLRGLLRSAVDRAVTKEVIVVIDSLNNIKGYRYELWCLARAAGVQYCVIYCDAGEDDCRSWNKSKFDRGDPCYDDKIFDDLVRRFERPDRRNRWDTPLFELRPSEGEFTESSTPIVEAVAFLTGNEKGRKVSRILQPTIATQTARISETNSLYELDRATQDVINALVESQTQELGSLVDIGEGLPKISFVPSLLQKRIGLPELRRHRRTFIRLAGQSSLSGPPPPSDSISAKRMFADYLNRELSDQVPSS